MTRWNVDSQIISMSEEIEVTKYHSKFLNLAELLLEL